MLVDLRLVRMTTNLRKLARGRPCQVRILGVCDGGLHSGTTVLAHYRLAGFAGWAMKPPERRAIGRWNLWCQSRNREAVT